MESRLKYNLLLSTGGDGQSSRQAEFDSFMGEELSVAHGQSDG